VYGILEAHSRSASRDGESRLETGVDAMTDGRSGDEQLGDLLQEFVNRVSHLQGNTLSVLTDESVTLQQVLLLRRLQQAGQSTPSELAEMMRMSPPAVSQMIDRIFILDLVTRAEAAEDRRRKMIAVTHKARQLLERIRKARAAEYAAGACRLSPKLRVELGRVLRKALLELPVEAEALVSTRTANAVEAVGKRSSSSQHE
jgi:DNA-binding MarR family transcriptional regulator